MAAQFSVGGASSAWGTVQKARKSEGLVLDLAILRGRYQVLRPISRHCGDAARCDLIQYQSTDAREGGVLLASASRARRPG